MLQMGFMLVGEGFVSVVMMNDKAARLLCHNKEMPSQRGKNKHCLWLYGQPQTMFCIAGKHPFVGVGEWARQAFCAQKAPSPYFS